MLDNLVCNKETMNVKPQPEPEQVSGSEALAFAFEMRKVRTTEVKEEVKDHSLARVNSSCWQSLDPLLTCKTRYQHQVLIDSTQYIIHLIIRKESRKRSLLEQLRKYTP